MHLELSEVHPHHAKRSPVTCNVECRVATCNIIITSIPKLFVFIHYPDSSLGLSTASNTEVCIIMVQAVTCSEDDPCVGAE